MNDPIKSIKKSALDINNQIDAMLNAQVANFKQSMKVNLEGLSERQRNISDKFVQAQKSASSKIRAEYDVRSTYMKNGFDKAIKSMGSQIDSFKTKLTSSFNQKDHTDAFFKNLTDGFKTVETQVDKMLQKHSEGIDKLSDKLLQVGQTLATLSIANKLDDAGKSRTDLKKQMVQAGLGAQGAADVINYSNQQSKDSGYKYDPSELMKQNADIIKGASLKSADQLKQFGNTFADFSLATGKDIDPKVVRDAVDNYQDAGGAMKQLTDTMVALNKANIMSDVGDMQASIEDTTASFKKLAESNGQGEDAVVDMQKQLITATAAFDNAGLKDYSKMFKDAAMEAANNPQEFMGDSKYAMMGDFQGKMLKGDLMGAQQEMMKFFQDQSSNPEQMAAVLQSMGMDPTQIKTLDPATMQKFQAGLQTAQQAAGNSTDATQQAANEVSDVTQGGIGGLFDKAINWVKSSGPYNAIADTLSQFNVSLANAANATIVASGILKAGKEILSFFTKGPGDTASMASKALDFAKGLPGKVGGGLRAIGLGGIADLGSSIGGGLSKAGNFATGMLSKIPGIGGLFGGAAEGGGALGGIAKFGGKALGAVGKFLGPLGATAGGLFDAYNNASDPNRDTTGGKVTAGIAGFLGGDKEGGLGNALMGGLKGAAIGAVAGPVGAAVGAIIGAIGGAVGADAITKFFDSIYSGVTDIYDQITKGIDNNIQYIEDQASGAWTAIEGFASSAWDAITSVAMTPFKLLGTLVDKVLSLIPGGNRQNSSNNQKPGTTNPNTGDKLLQGDYKGAAQQALDNVSQPSDADPNSYNGKSVGDLLGSGDISGVLHRVNTGTNDGSGAPDSAAQQPAANPTGTYLNGSDYIPSDMLATVHPGETILTGADNQNLTSALSALSPDNLIPDYNKVQADDSLAVINAKNKKNAEIMANNSIGAPIDPSQLGSITIPDKTVAELHTGDAVLTKKNTSLLSGIMDSIGGFFGGGTSNSGGGILGGLGSILSNPLGSSGGVLGSSMSGINIPGIGGLGKSGSSGTNLPGLGGVGGGFGGELGLPSTPPFIPNNNTGGNSGTGTGQTQPISPAGAGTDINKNRNNPTTPGAPGSDTTGLSTSYADQLAHANSTGSGFLSFFHDAFMNTKLNVIKAKANKNGPGSQYQINGENAGEIWKYFTTNGFTPYATAGIMGNFQCESGLMPNRVQGDGVQTAPEITVDGNTGYGLAQWTDSGRQQGLVDFATSKGTSTSDMQTQLDYALKEINDRGIMNDLNGSTDPVNGAYLFHQKFEGSADSQEAIINNRGGAANTIYSQFGGNAYAQGTPWVPNDQVALIHKGEAIIPADSNPYNQTTTSVGDNTDVLAVLQNILLAITNGLSKLNSTVQDSAGSQYPTRPSDYGGNSEIDRTFGFSNTY